MAVRRQAILQEPCRYYAPLAIPLSVRIPKMHNKRWGMRNKDGGEKEKEEEGLVRRYPRENKQSSMERGRGVMTDSAKLPVQWLKYPLHSDGRNIYIYI